MARIAHIDKFSSQYDAVVMTGVGLRKVTKFHNIYKIHIDTGRELENIYVRNITLTISIERDTPDVKFVQLDVNGNAVNENYRYLANILELLSDLFETILVEKSNPVDLMHKFIEHNEVVGDSGYYKYKSAAFSWASFKVGNELVDDIIHTLAIIADADRLNNAFKNRRNTRNAGLDLMKFNNMVLTSACINMLNVIKYTTVKELSCFGHKIFGGCLINNKPCGEMNELFNSIYTDIKDDKETKRIR